MDERKLATIRRIVAIEPIVGADRIVLAIVDGWQSVVKKDEFKVGDLVVFAEIDSVLPFKPWSEFLRDKRSPDKVIRLKTCKLKGTLSQGVIFPLDIIDLETFPLIVEEGLDVTEHLGIEKYNPQIPAHLAGKVKGNFPTHIFPKTDSERLQNLWHDKFKDEIQGVRFVSRVKADGTSFSTFIHNGEVGVCSRNLMLDLTDEGNVYVEMFKKYNLEEMFKSLNRNLVIQAEVIGPGIQKNRLNVSEKQIQVFDIFDIDTHRYFDYHDLMLFCDCHKLPEVTTASDDFIFDKEKHDLDFFIKMTERQYNGTKQQIEGLVFTPFNERYSPSLRSRLRFKVINPNYLLENE